MKSPSSSPPASCSNRTAGFTLIELLIAAAIGLVVLLICVGMITSAAGVQRRESLTLPVQESVRGAAELLAMDLREATNARVLSTSTALSELQPYASGPNSITIVSTDSSGSFSIPAPNGYPNSNSYPNSANTPITEPNFEGRRCQDVFSGGEWMLVTVGAQSWWARTHTTNPCNGGGNSLRVLHNGYTLPCFVWAPNASLTRTRVLRYYLSTQDDQPVLMREDLGQGAQVVAYGITALEVGYSTPTSNAFTDTPNGVPNSVRIKLTGQSSQNLPGTTRRATYDVTRVVFMRQTAIPAPTPTTPTTCTSNGTGNGR